MSNYERVPAWHKGMDLVDAVYEAVQTFPKSELFVLSEQLRSAATSIPLNIAEGNGRRTTADYRHFVFQARGSAYELESALMIARRRKFMSDAESDSLLQKTLEVCRLINGLLRYLKEHKGSA